MRDPQQVASPAQALDMLTAALGYLNAVDVASLPTTTQAEVLKGLEQVQSRHTAARSRALAAFSAQAGHEDDGLGSARMWLTFHTRTTRHAAAGSMAWMRRLAAHPVIGKALAAGELSLSWARQFCDWSDRLPADRHEDADRILCGAAAAGAELKDIAGLAEEMYARTREPDVDGDGGFSDRWLRMDVTFGGAGRVDGDLSPGCAAALGAVLDALGKRAGPEDLRTAAQRHHDALEDACRRLIASGMLPDRAGQPTQAQVHLSLRDLLGLADGAEGSLAEQAWRSTSGPGWLTGPEAAAAACDATLVPIVTGHVDWAAVDQLTQVFLAICELPDHATPAADSTGPGAPVTGSSGADAFGQDGPSPSVAGSGIMGSELSSATRDRLARALLGLSVQALSGPGGLAAALRARLGVPLATVSLPLDVGSPTPVIPPHLRRAALARHPCCAFPGCDTPATVCDIHHLLPRSDGGSTALPNLVPLCRFHHLVAVHDWGWRLTLHPDGTTTATSPQGRTIHSHSPPIRAA
ncbi:MAG TPA: DUF222 domain-containing protein [Streptosporangiaceae bacterium]|nr:DUF222 domain-containing protein [Streptosporangiaceae bacterium]